MRANPSPGGPEPSSCAAKNIARVATHSVTTAVGRKRTWATHGTNRSFAARQNQSPRKGGPNTATSQAAKPKRKKPIPSMCQYFTALKHPQRGGVEVCRSPTGSGKHVRLRSLKGFLRTHRDSAGSVAYCRMAHRCGPTGKTGSRLPVSVSSILRAGRTFHGALAHRLMAAPRRARGHAHHATVFDSGRLYNRWAPRRPPRVCWIEAATAFQRLSAGPVDAKLLTLASGRRHHFGC
jgi:hypothetical protein